MKNLPSEINQQTIPGKYTMDNRKANFRRFFREERSEFKIHDWHCFLVKNQKSLP